MSLNVREIFKAIFLTFGFMTKFLNSLGKFICSGATLQFFVIFSKDVAFTP